jgi:hypothetical protein
MPGHLRVMRWLAGPLILLAMTAGILYGHLPLAVLALALAALPGMYSGEIPYSYGPGLHRLRASLLLLSTLTVAAILWNQRSSLTAWFVLAAAIYAIWMLVAAAFAVTLVMKPEVRQRIYERQLRRGSPVSKT